MTARIAPRTGTEDQTGGYPKSYADERRVQLSGALGIGSDISWNEPGSVGPVFREDAIRQGLTTFNGEPLPAGGAANRHVQPPAGMGYRKPVAQNLAGMHMGMT